MAKGGKLKNNDGLVDSSNYTPKLAMPGAREIIEVKEETWPQIIWGWIKSLLGVFGVGLLVLAMLYSGLSATLMMYIPTGTDSTQRDLVVRNTWQETGNRPPLNTQVVISVTSALPENWLELIRVGWTGTDNPAIVRIASTEFDTLYIVEDSVTNLGESGEEGTFVGSPAFPHSEEDGTYFEEQNIVLDGQYLVECISGACEAGTFFIIDSSQIFGEQRVT